MGMSRLWASIYHWVGWARDRIRHHDPGQVAPWLCKSVRPADPVTRRLSGARRRPGVGSIRPVAEGERSRRADAESLRRTGAGLPGPPVPPSRRADETPHPPLTHVYGSLPESPFPDRTYFSKHLTIAAYAGTRYALRDYRRAYVKGWNTPPESRT